MERRTMRVLIAETTDMKPVPDFYPSPSHENPLARLKQFLRPFFTGSPRPPRTGNERYVMGVDRGFCYHQ